MRRLIRLVPFAITLATNACTMNSPTLAQVERDVPLCGHPTIGDVWPDADAGTTTHEHRGRLEQFDSSVIPLLRCGERISSTSCRVTLRAQQSVFGSEIGVTVNQHPTTTAQSLFARVLERTRRDGFVERRTSAQPPVAPNVATSAAAFVRNGRERALVLACVGDTRCALEIIEEERDCNAPGGAVAATLAAETKELPASN